MLFEANRAEGFRFDPFSPDYERDPHPTLRYMREHFPAYWWPEGPAWIFTRYNDAVTILKDRRFSADPATWECFRTKPERDKSVHEKLLETMLFSLSTEQHARIRRLVNPAFAPKAAEQLRAEINLIVRRSLPPAGPDGGFDVVQDYAALIPMAVMCDLLRVPEELNAEFRAFGAALFRGTSARLTADQKAALREPIASGTRMLRTVIEDRRKHLSDDLLSELIRAEGDGESLTYDELVGLVASLVAAGMDTTIQHITYAAFHLIRLPEQLRILQAEPALLRNALEEVLRYDFFARTGPSRYALEDLELRGVLVKRGQLVFPSLAGAMRDPEVFPDPDRLDIRRDLSRSIAFGGGIYHCLGVGLARVEVELAVAALFDRYPRLEIAGPPSYSPEPFFRTFASLPVKVRS
jgi:cytochrome P450 enzyme